jgi:hypothetical protein
MIQELGDVERSLGLTAGRDVVGMLAAYDRLA